MRAAAFFEECMRGELEGGEVEILFQPQVEVATGRIAGAEALSRWRQPQLGQIGADILFSLAARADLTDEMSHYVQARALAAAAGWPSSLSDLHLSINITAADAICPAFSRRFLAMIDQSGLDRRRITIELTETDLIQNLDAAAAHLGRFRCEGLRVALDDFGTGYSSLLYLKTLPIDVIKIDRRLTRDLAGSERDRVVVRTIIRLAHALQLDVVAEGVENREQFDLLAAEGCALYQGYLCSPPVDTASLAALVSLS